MRNVGIKKSTQIDDFRYVTLNLPFSALSESTELKFKCVADFAFCFSFLVFPAPILPAPIFAAPIFSEKVPGKFPVQDDT